MAEEKRYTAKQAARTVLERVNKLLKGSTVIKTPVQNVELKQEFDNLSILLKDGNNSRIDTLRKSIDGLLDLHKSLLPEAPKEMAVGEYKPCTKEDAAREIRFKLQELQDLRNVACTAKDEVPEALHVLESRFKAIKKDIASLADKYKDLDSIKDLKKSEGYKPQNSKKENAKPSEHDSKDADQHADGKGPKGEIKPKEKEQAPPDDTQTQTDPMKNSKEKAEGNNELAGTTPTQVGQDGKNKPGYDEMKGHLKLAKFLGMMEGKRMAKSKAATPAMPAQTGVKLPQ